MYHIDSYSDYLEGTPLIFINHGLVSSGVDIKWLNQVSTRFHPFHQPGFTQIHRDFSAKKSFASTEGALETLAARSPETLKSTHGWVNKLWGDFTRKTTVDGT